MKLNSNFVSNRMYIIVFKLIHVHDHLEVMVEDHTISFLHQEIIKLVAIDPNSP